MKAVLTCLVSEKIGPGSEADFFIRQLLKKTGYAAGALLRERLRGIELALKCFPAGSRIALSPLSDLSYRYVLESLSFRPVYVDSRGDIPAMDITALEQVHREDPVQGLILDHHLGFLPDMDRIAKLNLTMIQDISQILSSSPQGWYRGDVCLVNLEAENIITAGGGIFLAFQQKKGRVVLQSYPDDIFLPDMNAALGIIQLAELENFLEIRQTISDTLRQLPCRHRFLSTHEQPSPSSLPLLLSSPMQDVIQYGMNRQIEIAPAFGNSIIQAMLKDFDVEKEQSPTEHYPESTKFALRTVLLPLYAGLKKSDLELLERFIKALP